MAQMGPVAQIGQDYLARVGGIAWNQLAKMAFKAKATLAGDMLPDLLHAAAWIDKASGELRGIVAEVPFLLSTERDVQLQAMARVGMDVGLAALSALPVAGWIVGLIGQVAKMIAEIFLAEAQGKTNVRLRLPWGGYSEKTDEDIADLIVQTLIPLPDWSSIFLPPTDAKAWQIADGVDGEGQTIGSIMAPANGTLSSGNVAYNGNVGVIPGTFRTAGVVQAQGFTPDADKIRYYASGEVIWRGERLTQTGDFYVATSQLGGQLWQQTLKNHPVNGNPDAFKVDVPRLRAAWRQWFDALYGSAFDLGLGDFLMPYLAFKRGDEWCVGIDAAGVLRPAVEDGRGVEGPGASFLSRGHLVPLVTRDIWKSGLATQQTRTGCLVVEDAGGAQVGFPTYYQRDKAGRLVAPPAPTYAGRGRRCVPWPPGELLLQRYQRVDEAIIFPTLDALKRQQRASLARTLVCAYVRIDEVDGRPAYAAFRGPENKDLRDAAIAMRQLLLKHPDRMKVDFATAQAVDPVYAEQLRAAGVPTTRAQQAALRGLAAGGAIRPLDPRAPSPPTPPPVQGGLPFAPPPKRGGGKKSDGDGAAAAIGGAALLYGLSRIFMR